MRDAEYVATVLVLKGRVMLAFGDIVFVVGTAVIAAAGIALGILIRNTLNVGAILDEVKSFSKEEQAVIAAHVRRAQLIRLRSRSIGLALVVLGIAVLPVLLSNDPDVYSAVFTWGVLGYVGGGMYAELAGLRTNLKPGQRIKASAVLRPRDAGTFSSPLVFGLSMTCCGVAVVLSAAVAVLGGQVSGLLLTLVLACLLIGGTVMARIRIAERSQQVPDELSHEADVFLRQIATQSVELLSVSGAAMLLSNALGAASMVFPTLRPALVVFALVFLFISLTCLARVGSAYR